MFRKRSLTERFWEVIPGLQLWIVLGGSVVLSYYRPVWAALFIICFDLYWLLKAVNVASHLIYSYRRFRYYVTVDWQGLCEQLGSFSATRLRFEGDAAAARGYVAKRFAREQSARLAAALARGKTGTDFRRLYHLILLPFSNESFEVLESTFEALDSARYPHDRMLILLGGEERAGEQAKHVAEQVRKAYAPRFGGFFVTWHPDGLPGEIKGKSANASYALQAALPELERLGIAEDDVIVSNFDSDTVVHPQYFARVSYEFLLEEKPYRCSYQPIAVYNNNIWDTPAVIRVVSVSNSFWQFTESSRPDRLRTFSSHSTPLKTLREVGFWKKDIVNEDGFIYWQCYLKFGGDFRVIPLFVPISLDTCLAETTWQTLKNQYKQKRRWAYNVEYYPHLVPQLLRLDAPLYDRLYKLFQYVEGNFNWATASIMISCLGWMPLLIGGADFQGSVVAFNLPHTTKILMTTATLLLIFSVYINLVLLPPRPKQYRWTRSAMMYLQWFLVPIASVVFGSLPAVEAQTRLLLGRYLEFWVTPKARKGESTGLTMREMQSGVRP